MNKPTSKFYGLFQYLFDHFNDELFDGELKDCVIVVSRKKNVFGHYSHKRWYSNAEQETDELAINPTMISKFPLIEVCQTIVHEMCHAWQYHYGTPSRVGYHNKEWADKMEQLGLMPSKTGKPDGKRTGQEMADYPLKEGHFINAAEAVLNSDVFEGLFLEINPDILSLLDNSKPLFEQVYHLSLNHGMNANSIVSKPKSKIKYSCSCSNVWGKPGLQIICASCGEIFI